MILRRSWSKSLFERPKGQERTTHDLAEPINGERLRFTNAEQEWPIGELGAYYVHPGAEPAGVSVLRYTADARDRRRIIHRWCRWWILFMTAIRWRSGRR